MFSQRFKSTIRAAAVLILLCLLALPGYAQSSAQPRLTGPISPIYSWQNTSQPQQAVIILIHGITQRAESLRCLAQQLTSSGNLVYGIDLRGHGWWHFCHHQGEKGYRCDFKQSVLDVDALLSRLKEEHPESPVFIVGESVGAAVALRAGVDSPGVVSGLVLAGIGYKCCHAKTAWILSDLLKSCFRLHHDINAVRYQRRYGSDDLPALEETLKDPLQRKSLSVGELIQASRFISKNLKFARRLDPRISVLVVQGSDDRTLKPESAKKVFYALPTEDKELVVVPKCGHILLGTNHLKPLVSNSITAFVNEQISEQTLVAGTNADSR